MSQDYEYACQRAELLGLPVPTEEEWLETRKSEQENNPNEESAIDDVAENLDHSVESTQRVSGGLDELNSILNATQKKLNRFRTVCGSLGTLLKVRVGSRGNTPSRKPVERQEKDDGIGQDVPVSDENITVELSEGSNDPSDSRTNGQFNTTASKAKDINEKMGSHLDKLDSLISKAENAQYSMQHQSKQMRKFLK